MKITCGVDVLNRNYPTHSSRGNQKHSVATLALCYKARQKTKTDKDALFIMCTHQNPRGTKYKIHSNVDKLYTKYINEGKATIRFKDPPHDVIITKADPLQLKGFLHGVGLTIVGKGTGKIHFSSPPTKVDRPKKKLAIMKRSDYPTIKTGFPSSLTWLQVQACSIPKIDQRILNLRNLQVLDLVQNCIKELPVELREIKLKELVLSHNQIAQFPSELCTGALSQSLRVLDLSYNRLTNLPPYFCLMKNLSVLQLKSNRIRKLPRNMHCLESLSMFGAAHNELKALPFGVRKLCLDTLDLFHNPLNTDVVLRRIDVWNVPSLLECAASAIVKYQVHYTAEDIPENLRNFVIEHCPCPCGKTVFQRVHSCILMLDLQKLASTVVYINNTSRFKVPLEVYFCSLKCWRKFYSFTANQKD